MPETPPKVQGFDLPDTWLRKRLKYVATYNDEALAEDSDDFKEIEYIEISGVSLVGGVENVSSLQFHKAPSRARRVVRGGDTLVSTVRTYLKAIATVREASDNLIASTGFCVIRPGEDIDAVFLGWVMKSEPIVGEIVARSVGVSYPATNASEVVKLEVPLPDLETQRRIAEYLDDKTARIDALIEKKRALLDRLAEKRQALITRAVTRGLNPDAPLKDSGSEWLGEIPAHWSVRPLKWRVRVQSGQVDPVADEYKDFPLIAPDHIEQRTGRIIEVKTADEQSAMSGKYLCAPSSVLYSKIRPALRKAAVFGQECLCSADMYALNPGEEVERDFLLFFLLTEAFSAYAELSSLRVAMPKVNREALGAVEVCIPPLDEQREIARLCNAESEKHLTAIDEVSKSVDRLIEYRAALVTAAVTGKIKALLT